MLKLFVCNICLVFLFYVHIATTYMGHHGVTFYTEVHGPTEIDGRGVLWNLAANDTLPNYRLLSLQLFFWSVSAWVIRVTQAGSLRPIGTQLPWHPHASRYGHLSCKLQLLQKSVASRAFWPVKSVASKPCCKLLEKAQSVASRACYKLLEET